MNLRILIPFFVTVPSQRILRNLEITKTYLQAFAPVEVITAPDGSDAIWQKERLIDHAVANLPGDVDTVAWIDGDCLFGNIYWLDQAVEKLKQSLAVQLYSHFVRPDRHGVIGSGSTYDGAVYHWKTHQRYSGCPGAAWIARRELFSTGNGLFDADIMGGGDSTAMHAWIGMVWSRTMSPKLREAMKAWSVKATKFVRGRIDYVPGAILHLWHGDDKNRQYNERYQILVDEGFNPERHLTIGPSGEWCWTQSAPEKLKQRMRDYFSSRKDDG